MTINNNFALDSISMVGVSGFEPPASWSQTMRATTALHPAMQKYRLQKKQSQEMRCPMNRPVSGNQGRYRRTPAPDSTSS
jgi:hypothetical protein